MRRFFLPATQIHGAHAVLDGAEFHHLRHVLRLQVGTHIHLCDDQGMEYQGTIVSLSLSHAEIEITQVVPAALRFSLTLAQGLLKGQKMDLVIEKTTELGVKRLIPFHSQFTVAQLREDHHQSRLSRWQRLARSAAKQSGGAIPELLPPQSFTEFLRSTPPTLPTLLFYEKARQNTLKDFANIYPALPALCVIVGAEGGFAEEEVDQAREAGCHILSLGSQVLRAETASMVVVALCQFLWATSEVPPLLER